MIQNEVYRENLKDFSSYEKKDKLLNISALEFLHEEKTFENKSDKKNWSLYEENSALPPLKFSNGKTQEDIVKEITSLIKSGKKIILLQGVCGTGKSAIALNIARSLGKTSVVVPIKSLQKQYEQDYMGKKYVLKPNGKKLKIAMITGRENHDSIVIPGASCAYQFLPDTIKFTEKNSEKLREFYESNPFITHKDMPLVKELRRISVAPANPYWSPILPAELELNQLKDAKKRKYLGMFNREFVFYHRKTGCSYYDQYLSYLDADVIIFNSAKYLAECAIGRKPATEVDIIDEADEFLDNFSNSSEINLTRLAHSLKNISPTIETTRKTLQKLKELIDSEEKNKIALGFDPNKIYQINDTKISLIVKLLVNEIDLQQEIELDETNYANSVLEAAYDFRDSLQDTYVSFRKEDDSLIAILVTTNLSKRFRHLVDGNRSMVLMSGTLHSDTILREIFGITDFAKVEAEIFTQGTIEIIRTGLEFDCKYSNFQKDPANREKYILALSKIVEKSVHPTLVHVNAYNDLPSIEDSTKLNIRNIPSREEFRIAQSEDKEGASIVEFKQKKKEVLFTTKCSRGIDFPGDVCNSVVFTKYPNPNVQDTFWKILQKTHPKFYWEFYKDRAWREFLQKIYRAVRSQNDHVYVLSPDSRVLEAVRQFQLQSGNSKTL